MNKENCSRSERNKYWILLSKKLNPAISAHKNENSKVYINVKATLHTNTKTTKKQIFRIKVQTNTSQRPKYLSKLSNFKSRVVIKTVTYGKFFQKIM